MLERMAAGEIRVGHDLIDSGGRGNAVARGRRGSLPERTMTGGLVEQGPSSATSKNRYLETALAFLQLFFVRLGYLEGRPAVPRSPRGTHRKKGARAASIYGRGKSGRLLALEVPGGAGNVVYRAALLTGLRKDEIAKLEWGDICLDVDTPTPDPAAGNREQGRPPGRDRIAPPTGRRATAGQAGRCRELRLIRCSTPCPIGRPPRRISPGRGSRSRDAQGRQADFHSLRHTFCISPPEGGGEPWGTRCV